jgi:tetratricopeptide (TPR) repeat protein
VRQRYGVGDMLLAVQARLNLLAGDLKAAQKAIEQIRYDATPVFTFPYTDVHIFPIFSEVTLRLRQFDRVLAAGDLYTAGLQEAGLHASLPDVYYYRALALEAIGEAEAAREALRSAYAEAELQSSRRCQWRILAELARIEDEAGNAAEAKKLRRQAQEPVQYIAAHAGNPERRGSFLALVSGYGV